MSSESTGNTAAKEVLIERISTWFIDTLVISPYETREAEKRLVLSCTLSNTTIVSYNENPKMVRNAITVAGVTERPSTEYTPTLINTSCAMAAIAETAIFHSKRHEI